MTTLDDAVFDAAVAAAIRAPSMHNTQPWRFSRRPDGIDVIADDSRRLAVADPSGWAVRIACGAAVFNVRLAFAVHGVTPLVRCDPSPVTPTCWPGSPPARRTSPPRSNGGCTPPSRTGAATAHPSPRNRYPRTCGPNCCRPHARRAPGWNWSSDRPPSGPSPRSPTRPPGCCTAIPRTAPNWPPGPGRTAWRWTVYRPTPAGPARSRTTCCPAARSRLPDPARIRGGAGAAGRRPRHPGDLPGDQLTAGQALQRILLTITDAGLAASMLSQPIEVASAREQLRISLGRYGTPDGACVSATAHPDRPHPGVARPRPSPTRPNRSPGRPTTQDRDQRPLARRSTGPDPNRRSALE